MLLMFSALIAFLEIGGQIGACVHHKVELAGRIDYLVPVRVSPVLHTQRDLVRALTHVMCPSIWRI